MSNFRGKM